MTDQSAVEAVGVDYDRSAMLKVRAMTRGAIDEIAAAIHPGMAEETAVEITKDVLRKAGMVRGWHAPHVRFGRNTLKPFGAPSDPGVVLGENDLYFLDIGPVWQRYEGDAGATFAVGSDPEMLKIVTDVRRVFDDSRDAWLQRGLTGAGLYQFAVQRAQDLGWELNLDMNGHRLANFPHAAIHKGALADVPFRPSTALWVLEIQIRHPTRPFSAFYEDLLLEDAER